MLSAAELA